MRPVTMYLTLWMDVASLAAVLCRDQAVKVWEKREEFDKMGIKLVCIVHEWIQREVGCRIAACWSHATAPG